MQLNHQIRDFLDVDKHEIPEQGFTSRENLKNAGFPSNGQVFLLIKVSNIYQRWGESATTTADSFSIIYLLSIP